MTRLNKTTNYVGNNNIEPNKYILELEKDLQKLYNQFNTSMGFNKIETGDTSSTFTISGQAWDDLPPTPITSARLGSTAPTLATFNGNIEQYTFDATNDYVIGATEVTHSYAEGTTISPHIHWATNGVDGTNRGVKWQLEYSYSNATADFSTAVTCSADVTIPASTADRHHFVSDLNPDILDSSVKIGAYIVWRLNRITSGTAAPTSDPFCLAVGFHVLQDTVGSSQKYIK